MEGSTPKTTARMAGSEHPIVQRASRSLTCTPPSGVTTLLLQAEGQQRILKTAEMQKQTSGGKYYS